MRTRRWPARLAAVAARTARGWCAITLLWGALAGTGWASTWEPVRVESVTAAVGRLNHAGFRDRRHCTAVMVGPRTALTAAHCLDSVGVGSAHLLLGYEGGDWHEHLRPVGVHRAEQAGSDVAALCFAEDAMARPVPAARGRAATGAVVVVLGYGRPRAHGLSRTECRVMGYRLDGGLVLDCPLGPGTSGAPVLQPGSGAPELVGIVSATTADRALAYPPDGVPACG